MRVVCAVGVLALASCDARTSPIASSESSLSDCGGAPVMLSGDPAVPRSIVIDNGIVRVSYPELPNPDQRGGHMLELNVDGMWKPVLGSWYGDWTFFASPFFEPAHTAHVLTETPDAVEVAFEFDHWLDHPGYYSTHGHVPRWWNEETQGPCTVEAGCGCYLAGCGIAQIDHDGYSIFPTADRTVPKYVRHVTFTKVIRVERCSSGYFVGYHSNPSLIGPWIENHPTLNNAGEREHGLGWMSSVTFASSGVIVHNPEAGQHTSLGILEQAAGPWWFATIPPADAFHPYVLFMAEEHPLPSFVWQFSPTHYGIPLVHKMNPEIELDGRPGRYQTFLGAFPYTSPDREAEPTPEARAGVVARLPEIWP
ncbi:MAG TPA: hypothetical protein VM734_10770 [Kofleriaceae bacterium]|jgi:hypothetical protein|nr:hypothetical protein [Kofleriaceae bacterium]